MSVWGSAVAGERGDASESACLCMYVARSESTTHASLQRAILSRYRQRGIEVNIYVGVAVGIAQECHLKLWCDIVVEREPAAVGYLVAGGVKSHSLYQSRNLPSGVLCLCGTLARLCCQLVEHRLGIEIVAILHHAHQYLVDGVESGADYERPVGQWRFAR